MRVSDALAEAGKRLEDAGIDEPRLEVASLLAVAIGRDRTFLFAYPEYKLSADENEKYRSMIDRRSGREPFHYIVGSREFYGLDFRVTPDVLIPRPETEILVERAIELLRPADRPRLLEIGVGSGCISVSVLKQIPLASAIGVDISEAALAVARENAEKHGVADRLQLSLSNVYDGVDTDDLDAILSNPPYIPADDLLTLQPEVRDFEPPAALTDGGDGLAIIREIVRGAPGRLAHRGHLLIEFGFGQSESVLSMFGSDIWQTVEVADDLQGIPRTVIATRR